VEEPDVMQLSPWQQPRGQLSAVQPPPDPLLDPLDELPEDPLEEPDELPLDELLDDDDGPKHPPLWHVWPVRVQSTHDVP
jgi:hypothetical protein